MTLVVVVQLRAKSLQAADRIQYREHRRWRWRWLWPLHAAPRKPLTRRRAVLAGVRDTALQTEPGTKMYLTTRAQADPLEFLLFEEYVDELALKRGSGGARRFRVRGNCSHAR